MYDTARTIDHDLLLPPELITTSSAHYIRGAFGGQSVTSSRHHTDPSGISHDDCSDLVAGGRDASSRGGDIGGAVYGSIHAEELNTASSVPISMELDKVLYVVLPCPTRVGNFIVVPCVAAASFFIGARLGFALGRLLVRSS